MRLLWLAPLLAVLATSESDSRVLDAALTQVAGDRKVILIEQSFPCAAGCRLPQLTDPAARELVARLEQRNSEAVLLDGLALARPVERISFERWKRMQYEGGMGGVPVIYAQLPAYSDDGRVALVSFAIAREAGEGVETGIQAMLLRLGDQGWQVTYDSYQRVSRSAPGSASDAPYRPGGGVRAPVIKKRVEAAYTEEARRARVSGVIIVELVVGKDGRPRDIRVLKPLPFGLDEAAIEAVKQWEFEPGTLDGKPVDVIFNVTVSFHLE